MKRSKQPMNNSGMHEKDYSVLSNEVDTPAQVIEDVRRFIDLGQNKLAIQMLELARDKGSSNKLILGMLAEEYNKKNRFEEAEKVWSECLEGEKAPYWAFIGYGNTLERSGKVNLAAESFLTALNEKYSEELTFRLVRMLEHVGDKKSTISKIVSCIVKQGTDDDAVEKLLKFGDYSYRSGDYISAIELYDNAVEVVPSHFPSVRKKVKSQIRANEYRDASVTVTEWQIKNPDDKRLQRFTRLIEINVDVAPHIQILKRLFIPEYYRSKYVSEPITNEEAFDHFLDIGMYKKHNPNPWFNSYFFEKEFGKYQRDGEVPITAYIRLERDGVVKPSPLFDPVYYRNTNKDIAKHSSELAHYVEVGQFDGRLTMEKILPDVILSEYKEMLEHEPKLLMAADGLNSIVRYPKVYPSIFVPGNVKKQIKKHISAVVCVPFVTRGGADLISTYAVRALQEHFGIDKVLLIVTESTDVELKSWIDKRSKIVVFGMEATYRSFEDKVLALHNTIGQFEPDVVLNVNSKTCWEMYKCYGKQLSSATSLFGYLFCHDYDKERNRVGYVTEYLSETVSYLDGVVVDNAALVKNLLNDYRFSTHNSSKFNTVYTPFIEDTLHYQPNDSGDGVLWIGRLSEQKRPDVLLKIAEKMQYQTFYVYGPPGNAEESNAITSNNISNIKYMGTYENLHEIDFSLYKLFLHTSEWEGLPTVLIQMMGIGIPIITSEVGGVSELVNDDTGAVVKKCDDIEVYCMEITKAFTSYDKALKKAANGFELVRERHSWKKYVANLNETGIFCSQREGGLFKLSDEYVDVA